MIVNTYVQGNTGRILEYNIQIEQTFELLLERRWVQLVRHVPNDETFQGSVVGVKDLIAAISRYFT